MKTSTDGVSQLSFSLNFLFHLFTLYNCTSFTAQSNKTLKKSEDSKLWKHFFWFWMNWKVKIQHIFCSMIEVQICQSVSHFGSNSEFLRSWFCARSHRLVPWSSSWECRAGTAIPPGRNLLMGVQFLLLGWWYFPKRVSCTNHLEVCDTVILGILAHLLRMGARNLNTMAFWMCIDTLNSTRMSRNQGTLKIGSFPPQNSHFLRHLKWILYDFQNPFPAWNLLQLHLTPIPEHHPPPRYLQMLSYWIYHWDSQHKPRWWSHWSRRSCPESTNGIATTPIPTSGVQKRGVSYLAIVMD